MKICSVSSSYFHLVDLPVTDPWQTSYVMLILCTDFQPYTSPGTIAHFCGGGGWSKANWSERRCADSV